MKLTADRLATQTGKGLAPLYVLTGDEPLLVDEALETIRAQALRDGCAERETHFAERSFDWDGFAAGLRNISLFSSRRLIELRVPGGKPGEAGARVLTELAAHPDAANVIVLVLPALDGTTSRSRWATVLAEKAAWVELKPPPHEQLPAWLRGRLRRAGLEADDAALEILAARVEGNLLAAKQEMDKLALLVSGGRVTEEAVRDSVADGARFDIFQLTDAALAGDVSRTVRVLGGLEREGESAVLVLWALLREAQALAGIVVRAQQGRGIDAAMEELRIWRSRQGLYRQAAHNRSLADVERLLGSAARADLVVKGTRPGQPWNALLELGLELAGARPALAETA